MPVQTRSQTKKNQQNVQEPVKPETTDFEKFVKAQETRDPVLYRKLANIKNLVKEPQPSIKTFNPDVEWPQGQIVTVTVERHTCLDLILSFYDKFGVQYCSGRMLHSFAKYTKEQRLNWESNRIIPSSYDIGKSFDAVIYRYDNVRELYWLAKV